MLLHEAIFPATCNAKVDESIARQVAGYMLHAAIYLATLRKLGAQCTFPVRRNWMFWLQDMMPRGDVTHAISSATCFATPLRFELQKNFLVWQRLQISTANWKSVAGLARDSIRSLHSWFTLMGETRAYGYCSRLVTQLFRPIWASSARRSQVTQSVNRSQVY